MYKCKHFGVKELVSREVYNFYQPRYGENFIWCFFHKDVLEDIDTIREAYGGGIIINNWAVGGQYNESGLRSNVDSLVKAKKTPYLGGHNLAVGFDMKPSDRNYKRLHSVVWDLMNKGKLKRLKRLENMKSTPTWVHTDGLETTTGKPQIFNV